MIDNRIDELSNRELFLEGIDYSYYYEKEDLYGKNEHPIGKDILG